MLETTTYRLNAHHDGDDYFSTIVILDAIGHEVARNECHVCGPTRRGWVVAKTQLFDWAFREGWLT